MAVVDFARMQGESAFVKKALSKFGINFDINQAIAELAKQIRDHKHLQRLVTETEPNMRTAFYESVRPHLTFRAKPLDVYISEAGQMAEREQLPTLMPDGTLQEYKAPSVVLDEAKAAENIMARELANRTITLTCWKCTKQGEFYGIGGETPVAIVMKARRAGWVHNPITFVEACPECSVNA